MDSKVSVPQSDANLITMDAVLAKTNNLITRLGQTTQYGVIKSIDDLKIAASTGLFEELYLEACPSIEKALPSVYTSTKEGHIDNLEFIVEYLRKNVDSNLPVIDCRSLIEGNIDYIYILVEVFASLLLYLDNFPRLNFRSIFLSLMISVHFLLL